MHIYLWLLRASFLVISTTAFYPLRPLDVLPGTPKVADGSEKRILSPMRGDDGRIQKRKHMKLSMKRKAAPIHSHSHHWSGIELEAIDRRNSKDLNKKDNQEITELHPRTQVRRSNDYKIVTASQPKQTDSVAIDQDGTDFSYFSAIQLGERGKIMRVLVDTGAANTWVMGSNCTSGPCLTHNTFGAKDSNTMHTTTAEFNLAYGTGTVSGLIVNDTVKMAGFLLPLYFGAASVVSDDFSWYPVDGILGLGRPASNIVKFPTIMEAIDKSKLLQKNLIGINLQRNADRSTDGELNFGSPDRTKYSGDLSYTKTVQAKERWEIPIDDAGVNGFACGFSNKTAIIDTGTSFVLLPPADAKLIHNQIPDSQQTGEQFNVPCTSELPVQIIISGVTYNISAKDYVGNPINSGNLCSSNIVGKAAFGPDQWLVGDVFLKNVYTVLDFDEERIGFGVKLSTEKSATSSIVTSIKTSSSPNVTSMPQSSASPTILSSVRPLSASVTISTTINTEAVPKFPSAPAPSSVPSSFSPPILLPPSSAPTSPTSGSLARILPSSCSVAFTSFLAILLHYS